jgi:hypothetical protein
MSEQLFDVVFFGILQAGKDKEVVMQNMATLFKTDAANLAPYFTGNRKVIKGKISAAVAEKYKNALENVGLVVKIEACKNEQSPEQAKSSKGSDDKEQDTNQQIDTSGISVAPVGVDILENPEQVVAQEIEDISELSMAEAGADVIENPAPISPQKIEDTSGISIAEPGSDVLENPVKVVAQKIDDISGISMAEAGADIIENPKPKETADIPDISELSLDNSNSQA